MKKAIVLAAALTLAAPAAMAQSQVQPLNTTTSTAGPAVGLAGASAAVFGIIGLSVLLASSSTNGT